MFEWGWFREEEEFGVKYRRKCILLVYELHECKDPFYARQKVEPLEPSLI